MVFKPKYQRAIHKLSNGVRYIALSSFFMKLEVKVQPYGFLAISTQKFTENRKILTYLLFKAVTSTIFNLHGFYAYRWKA